MLQEKVSLFFLFLIIHLRMGFIAGNVLQIHAGREFPDKFPTKIYMSKFQVPVNEASKPDLLVFCCYALLFFIRPFSSVTNTAFVLSLSKLILELSNGNGTAFFPFLELSIYNQFPD